MFHHRRWDHSIMRVAASTHLAFNTGTWHLCMAGARHLKVGLAQPVAQFLPKSGYLLPCSLLSLRQLYSDSANAFCWCIFLQRRHMSFGLLSISNGGVMSSAALTDLLYFRFREIFSVDLCTSKSSDTYQGMQRFPSGYITHVESSRCMCVNRGILTRHDITTTNMFVSSPI